MSDIATVLNHPYVDEARLQREDILARLLGISQLEYEDDLYTHHDGSVWDYFGEISLFRSTDESSRFWVWVQSSAGLQGELDDDGIVLEHSLNVTYGIPIEMGEEIDAPEGQHPRYDRAFAELPVYVWAVNERREWRDKSINAANDVGMGYDSATDRFNEAQQHLPGNRPVELPALDGDADGPIVFLTGF